MVGVMKPAYQRRFVRRASAVVETAVVAPLMITAMFGMLEAGYAFMVKQSVALAAREGARAGAMPGATMDDVRSAVDVAMTAPHLSGYTTTSNLSGLSTTDTDISVTVTIPFSRVSFTGNLLGGGGFDITSSTTMRREGLTGDSGSGGSGGSGIGT
jgi:hypothetical protein